MWRPWSAPRDLPNSTAAIDVDIASARGQIYGHDIANDIMIAIDKTTAAATVLGSTTQNGNFAQGMDFDLSTNVLYAYMYIGTGVNRPIDRRPDHGRGHDHRPRPGWSGERGRGQGGDAGPGLAGRRRGDNGVLQPNETGGRGCPELAEQPRRGDGRT